MLCSSLAFAPGAFEQASIIVQNSLSASRAEVHWKEIRLKTGFNRKQARKKETIKPKKKVKKHPNTQRHFPKPPPLAAFLLPQLGAQDTSLRFPVKANHSSAWSGQPAWPGYGGYSSWSPCHGCFGMSWCVFWCFLPLKSLKHPVF